VSKGEPAPGPGPRSGPGPSLVFYVEGPRDRSILRAWAYRLMPRRARVLFQSSVILGGRRPERALEHFAGRFGHVSGVRAICVLDRDGGDEALPDTNGYDLRFFTWTRRHIESYLLVPQAIRRALDLPEGDRRVERLLLELLPKAGDEPAWRSLDAKRLLTQRGPIPRALGQALPLARIARSTREAELHPDVHALFGEVEGLMGPDPRRG